MIATGLIPKRDCPGACRNPKVAKRWGCKPGTKSKFPFTVDTDDGKKETVYRCPYAILRKTDVWQVIYYFRQYRQGFLPAAGGVLDQPMKLMQALDFLAVELPEYEKRAQEKEDAAEEIKKKIATKRGEHGRTD